MTENSAMYVFNINRLKDFYNEFYKEVISIIDRDNLYNKLTQCEHVYNINNEYSAVNITNNIYHYFCDLITTSIVVSIICDILYNTANNKLENIISNITTKNKRIINLSPSSYIIDEDLKDLIKSNSLYRGLSRNEYDCYNLLTYDIYNLILPITNEIMNNDLLFNTKIVFDVINNIFHNYYALMHNLLNDNYVFNIRKNSYILDIDKNNLYLTIMTHYNKRGSYDG